MFKMAIKPINSLYAPYPLDRENINIRFNMFKIQEKTSTVMETIACLLCGLITNLLLVCFCVFRISVRQLFEFWTAW